MKRKPKKQHRDYKVVVVGGGMSGICAAIAAARQGIDTALIHGRHVLGGNASSEIRMHICGASENGVKAELEEGGILYEIMLENKFRNDTFNYSIWDMVLYQTVKLQNHLTVFFNTVMEDCSVCDGVIQEVDCYQQTTETYYKISGNIFIDCTGNGTLGYLAGAEFRQGSESKYEFNEPHAPERSNNNRMGNTLLFKSIEREDNVVFKTPVLARKFSEEQLKYRPHSTVHTSDESLSDDYIRMTSFSCNSLDYGYWWCELTGTSDDIVDDFESIRDELVSCIYGIWDHLKNGGYHAAEKYDLEWVGMMPGVRESRRLVGDYILNENDILSGKVFEDAVAYGGWAIDIHTANGLYDFDKLPSSITTFPGTYTIPYRSYYSKNIKNLMMAGRNISVSKMALGSTRVMGTCAIGGQAVGTAAALCIRHGCVPRELTPHIRELQQTLIRDDCYIPGYENADENDLARRAKVTASSEQEGGLCTNVINGISRNESGYTNLWVSQKISEHGEKLQLSFDNETPVSQVRLVFDTNFKYSIKITLSNKRRQQQRIGVPEELVKDYDVILKNKGETVREICIRDNYQRLNVLDFASTLCDQLIIRVLATNGCPSARIFEVRAY